MPKEWRPVFSKIADAFVAGDYALRDHAIPSVAPVDPFVASDIARNISAYGDAVAPLHPSTWDRSIYRWMEGYWLVLVDLTTTTEQVSDLTLHAVLRDGDTSIIEIESVHVS